jgi:hypothetical protein
MEIDIAHKEWPDDEGKVLKQVPFGNPFTVPQNYFEELSGNIQSRIAVDELLAGKPEGFEVPTNYFETLSDQIQSRITLDELLNGEPEGLTVPENYFEELSGNIQSRITIDELAGTEAESFEVPEGYFDELSSNIQSRIAIEEFVNGKQEHFTVPENYFEDQHEQITSRIRVEEMAGAREESFTVPDGYFDQLNERILNQTTNAGKVKVKQGVIRKLVSYGAFKYASAACLAIIVGVAIYVKQSPSNNHADSYLHKQLSEIPANDIQNFLELQTDGMDTEHTVVAEGTNVNDAQLKSALQDALNEQ